VRCWISAGCSNAGGPVLNRGEHSVHHPPLGPAFHVLRPMGAGSRDLWESYDSAKPRKPRSVRRVTVYSHVGSNQTELRLLANEREIETCPPKATAQKGVHPL